MKQWQKTRPDQIVYKKWRQVISKEYKMPNGKVADFEAWSGDEDCAGVIAITKDNQVVVSRQFRFGPEAYMDEIPGGWLESGEQPIQCAKRELEEETGYSCGEIFALGSVFKDANFHHKHHYFLAKDCYKKTAKHTDENEFVELITISIEDLIANAKNGKMTDPAAVLMAYEELIKIKEGKDETKTK